MGVKQAVSDRLLSWGRSKAASADTSPSSLASTEVSNCACQYRSDYVALLLCTSTAMVFTPLWKRVASISSEPVIGVSEA